MQFSKGDIIGYRDRTYTVKRILEEEGNQVALLCKDTLSGEEFDLDPLSCIMVKKLEDKRIGIFW